MHWIRHYEKELKIDLGLDENEVRELMQAAYSVVVKR
jgi:hypothetical protein